MRLQVTIGALVVSSLLVGCTGVPETRVPAKAGREPITHAVVLVDTDLIGQAFASYKGSGSPFGSTSADYRGFMEHFTAAIREQSKAAGVNAQVQAVSLNSMRTAGARHPSGGLPVLTIRATGYTNRKELVGGRDLGWSGDTAWDFTLSERAAASAYQPTWSGVIRSENLNPVLCGNYERCSRSMAERMFTLMRKDGIVR